MQLASSTARTVYACTLPIFAGSQIAFPKRPSFALARTGVVNLTFSRLIIEEDAISIAEFLQTSANPDFSRILILEILDRQLNQFCDRVDFRLIDPHIARCARAAVAASGTGEFQPVLIPTLIGSLFFHSALKVVCDPNIVMNRKQK